MKKMSLMLTVLAILFAAVSVQADVRLPKTFTDNAVFQRNVPINVWGWADPGEEVTVTFAGQKAFCKACEKGCWSVSLPACAASFEGRDLIVKGKNEVKFANILVGEVWVCSGQSNMEMPLNSWGQPRLACSDEEIDGDYSFIRFNRSAHRLAAEPAKDLDCLGWQLCKDGVQKSCTACGFHFAVRLNKELNVPVGLIDVNWGGSNIDSWIPDAGWDLLPELASVKNRLQKARDLCLKKENYKTLEKGLNPNAYKAICADSIGAMYNAMLAPWTKYAIKGALWYQGESNAGEREFYYYKQKAMIFQWRKIWNQGDFPFYWVSLANFTAPKDNPNDTGSWPGLRDGQTKCLDVKNSGQAIIIDIGEEKDIHPRNKFDVGNRLALWALANDYGKKIDHKSPIFKCMKIDGDKIVVKFDNVGKGLVVGKQEPRQFSVDAGASLKRFAIAGADKNFVWADAKIIDKETVVISAKGITAPVAVRYAWQMNPTGCNLYSAEGLPATPFRTDAW